MFEVRSNCNSSTRVHAHALPLETTEPKTKTKNSKLDVIGIMVQQVAADWHLQKGNLKSPAEQWQVLAMKR